MYNKNSGGSDSTSLKVRRYNNWGNKKSAKMLI